MWGVDRSHAHAHACRSIQRAACSHTLVFVMDVARLLTLIERGFAVVASLTFAYIPLLIPQHSA